MVQSTVVTYPRINLSPTRRGPQERERPTSAIRRVVGFAVSRSDEVSLRFVMQPDPKGDQIANDENTVDGRYRSFDRVLTSMSAATDRLSSKLATRSTWNSSMPLCLQRLSATNGSAHGLSTSIDRRQVAESLTNLSTRRSGFEYRHSGVGLITRKQLRSVFVPPRRRGVNLFALSSGNRHAADARSRTLQRSESRIASTPRRIRTAPMRRRIAPSGYDPGSVGTL